VIFFFLTALILSKPACTQFCGCCKQIATIQSCLQVVSATSSTSQIHLNCFYIEKVLIEVFIDHDIKLQDSMEKIVVGDIFCEMESSQTLLTCTNLAEVEITSLLLMLAISASR
jgi:hypothetical protein